MSTAGGLITRLPTRFKRQWRSEKKEETKQIVPKALTVQDKVATLRLNRVTKFFGAKARHRAGAQSLASVLGSSSSAVLRLLRSLRHVAVGFLSRKSKGLTALVSRQSKWGKRLRMLPSALTGEKSMLSMLQKTLGRTFGRKAERKAQAERERRQHQVRIYQWMCRALARLGRSAIVAAHKRRRAEGAALLSREIVKRLLEEQPPILAVKFVILRERERLANNARVIQRLWRGVKRNEQAAIEGKARLLNMLSNMPSCLRQHQDSQQQTLKCVHEASTTAVKIVIRRAAQRLATRLIQRVWRGHCARVRARRLRDWKLRKFTRRRQRERVSAARSALLVPSEMELQHRRELETRMLARQQETPLLPVSRREEARYQRRRGDRAALLEPLCIQSRPPQFSTTTRAKVQCVPFSRFEKIIAQDARVNLHNVWVAIPVGHQEVLQAKNRSRHGGLSPLLVGKGRKKKEGGLHTTYNWVPAHLLQSQEDRELRRNRRG